jgi:hypothetical protein
MLETSKAYWVTFGDRKSVTYPVVVALDNKILEAHRCLSVEIPSLNEAT